MSSRTASAESRDCADDRRSSIRRFENEASPELSQILRYAVTVAADPLGQFQIADACCSIGTVRITPKSVIAEAKWIRRSPMRSKSCTLHYSPSIPQCRASSSSSSRLRGRLRPSYPPQGRGHDAVSGKIILGAACDFAVR